MRITGMLSILGLSILLVQAQPTRNFSTDERALIGKEWRLVSMGPSGGETGVVPGTKVVMRFGDDRRASGSSGCNSFGGTYFVRGDTISFGAMISTWRACTDRRANRQEQQFLAAFNSARRFRLAANRLAIYYDAGRNVLNFVDANPGPSRPEESETSDGDAVEALSSYYAAINDRNYERAYRYWESPTSSFERFVQGFADTDRSRLFVEPRATVEGAAGSLYAEIPTIIIAETRNGRERFFAGCYVMRRRNDREGTWRIYRANLLPVTANAALTQRLSANCQR